MTEVFKSEAIHTLSGLVWTVFVTGAMVVMSLLFGSLAYTSDISYVPSVCAALVAILFFSRAKKYYNILNIYIHFPPNCKIVDTRSLTSDD